MILLNALVTPSSEISNKKTSRGIFMNLEIGLRVFDTQICMPEYVANNVLSGKTVFVV